jgi:hypothetical protein
MKAIESRYTAAEEFADAGVDCWRGHSLVPTPVVVFVLFVVRAGPGGQGNPHQHVRRNLVGDPAKPLLHKHKRSYLVKAADP